MCVCLGVCVCVCGCGCGCVCADTMPRLADLLCTRPNMSNVQICGVQLEGERERGREGERERRAEGRRVGQEGRVGGSEYREKKNTRGEERDAVEV